MKNTLYRKLLYVISMVLLSLVAVLLFRPEEGIFRMHVIANSDSAADQATKLAVRDAILDYERGMGNVGSAEEVKARLMDDGRGICTAIDKVLRERGMDYSAELHIGTYDFPDREYGGKLYPAGRYQALRVILGEGKGKNWWCVMYPPLCIPAAESMRSDADQAEAYFDQGEYDLLTNPRRYRARLKCAEVFSRLWDRIRESADEFEKST